MKKLVLLLTVLGLALSAVGVSAQPLEVQSVCSMAIPDKVRVFDWSNWNTSYIQDQNLYFEPFRWDASNSLWRGYDAAKEFAQPDDIFKHWSVTLTQPNGAEQWIYIFDSHQTPDTDYVYVFQTTTEFGDAQGNHYGFHPCTAFATSASMINDWIHQVYNG